MTVASWMCVPGSGSVSNKEAIGGQNDAQGLLHELCKLEAQLPARLSSRDAKAAMLSIRSILSFGMGHTDCTAAVSEPGPQAAKRSSSFDDGKLMSHPIVKLVDIAQSNQMERVHGVCCMVLGSMLDNSSSWALSEAFMPEGTIVGSCGLLQMLSADSVLQIMAHISSVGLERLLTVCPAYKNLLSTPEARIVFEKRMHPVGDLFEVLMQSHDGSCCPAVSWQDAFGLFGALLTGTAALDPLPHLLGSIVEKIAMQSPQHLGHITMFTVVLHAIEAGAQRQMPGRATSTAPSQAAAEVFFSTIKHLHSSLHSRLSYIAACAESSSAMAPTEQMATEYFETLSQSRELLSRAQELAAVTFSADIAAVFQQQVSRLSDGLLLNFGVSDRAVALAGTLPTAIAALNPAIGRLLSAMFFRVLPAPERERLGLAMPTVRALDESSMAACKMSFMCEGGSMTSEVPYSLMKTSLGRIASHVRLFWKWRAMHKVPINCRFTSGMAPFVEEEALLCAPLNVNLRAFNEVLDFARIAGMTSVIGDCSVQQMQFKQNWLEQVANSAPAFRRSVLHCAHVLGAEEIVHALGSCSEQEFSV